MKLVRYGAAGREKPGIIAEDGKIRDLSRIVKDIDGAMLASGGLAKIKKANLKRMKPVAGKPRLGPCVGNVAQLHRHRPELFRPRRRSRHAGAEGADHLQQGADLDLRPERRHHRSRRNRTKLDWEVEIGIVIGKRARYLTKENTKAAIAGYFLSNDVSERDFQIERSGGQWNKGKGCETFGPIGPWFVTKDEMKNPQNLNMWLDVNGEKRQRGNTKTMIFDCEHIVWYCSQFFVMEPGDIIITGTPPGVGLGMKPTPQFLKAGDIVTLGIDGLGEQRQKIVAFKA